MSRLIDADALIEFCAERWIPLNIDAVNMQPTIQPEKAQLSQEGTTSDFSEPTRIIPETRAIPSADDRVSLSEKVTATFYDDEYEEWSQKTVTVRDVLDAVCDEYTVLPTIQPERKKGEWIDCTKDGYVECPFCHSATNCDGNKDELHFCFSCGADMRGEQNG